MHTKKITGKKHLVLWSPRERDLQDFKYLLMRWVPVGLEDDPTAPL